MSCLDAAPVVPSWWITTEAARLASSSASRNCAPDASATARLAMTASPAPTMSIGPRKGGAGTCSTSPFGLAPSIPRSANVTKTGRPCWRARELATCFKDVTPDFVEMPATAASSRAFILRITGGQSRKPRRLSARIGRDLSLCASFPIAFIVPLVTTPVSGTVTWSSTMTASNCGASRNSDATIARSTAAGVGVQFFVSSRLSSRGVLPGSITSGLQYVKVRRFPVCRKPSSRTAEMAASARRNSQPSPSSPQKPIGKMRPRPAQRGCSLSCPRRRAARGH